MDVTPQTLQMLWFWGSTIVLGTALFFPVSKVIWVMRIRRSERKLGRVTTDEERQGELRSSRFIGAFIIFIFAFLFNRTLFGSF